MKDNQVLYITDTPLGWWQLWANDTVARLDGLRITPKKPIKVNYEPTEYPLGTTDGITYTIIPRR